MRVDARPLCKPVQLTPAQARTVREIFDGVVAEAQVVEEFPGVLPLLGVGEVANQHDLAGDKTPHLVQDLDGQVPGCFQLDEL